LDKSLRLFFSTIIPTYNRAAYLDAALPSALGQMIPGDELIVVDDGSDDDTRSVLHKYGERIKVIQGGHGGAGRARNLGIKEARNELVAFLDSDDTWLPGKLEVQRSFMERRSDILFSFTNFEVEHRDGVVRKRYLDLWHREHKTWEEAFGPGVPYSSMAPLPAGISDFPVYEGDIYRLQLTGFYVLTDTLVARRKEAGDALHFAEDLKTYEDLECFYRLSRRGKAAFLDVDAARQLDHPCGRLSQLSNLDKIEARLTLAQRIWGEDCEFLSIYGEKYRRVLNDLFCQKAGLLLILGRNQEAREILSLMFSPPARLRLLSRLPATLTLALIKLRRKMKVS
jgi:glycosyltransferase involved in cell wall biosynthesis